MVYSICYCPLDYYDELKSFGFMDSKMLTQEKRNHLFNIINQTDYIGWSMRILSPQDLSQYMLRR
jgi:ribonuclease H2 subunit A